MGTLPPRLDDGYDEFCLYCQRFFASQARLRTHVYRKHEGTYAYHHFKDHEQAAIATASLMDEPGGTDDS